MIVTAVFLGLVLIRKISNYTCNYSHTSVSLCDCNTFLLINSNNNYYYSRVLKLNVGVLKQPLKCLKLPLIFSNETNR